MDNVNLALEGASAVLLAGLVFGAGLPVVYAIGPARPHHRGGDLR